MSRAQRLDVCLDQGTTWRKVVCLGGKPIVYAAISAITQTAPARITATAHGILDGYSVAVVSVKGMTQINAELDSKRRPKSGSYVAATVIDANTITLNDVNAADFSAYTSGGYLQTFTPTDLAGSSATLTIKDAPGGAVLLTLDSSGHGITIDNTAKTITFAITAVQTAALTWTDAVYEAVIQFADGTVKALFAGYVTVTRE